EQAPAPGDLRRRDSRSALAHRAAGWAACPARACHPQDCRRRHFVRRRHSGYPRRGDPLMQSSRNAVAREVAELFAAKTPIVYLVTQEEERAVAICKLVAELLRATASTWSLHSGLVPVAPGAREPLSLLESLHEAPASSLAVLLDFHQAWC